MSERKAQLWLMAIAAIWGVTFPLIRTAMSQIDAYTWGIYRFTLAITAFVLVALFQKKSLKVSKDFIVNVFGLGFILGVSYLSQSKGLETISSGRSAFITGTNIVMVPIIVCLLEKKNLRAIEWISACGALFGLYLLTDPKHEGVSFGDLLTLVCAITYAIYVVYLQKLIAKYPEKTFELTFYQILAVWLVSLASFPLAKSPLVHTSPQTWFALIFCASIATILTSWLQTKYQRYTSAQKAALVFSMEPMFAAIFGFFLLHETMSLQGLCGAALILFATFAPELFIMKKTSKTLA